MSEVTAWSVDPDDGGERIDRVLARQLEVPRSRVQRWIREGRVQINDRPAKAASVLQVGDRIVCQAPDAPPDPGLTAQPGELVRLYEDEDVLVLDKPAGVAVHPGAGRADGTLANFLLHHYPQLAGVGGPGRPGIVHRLDLATTGALLVALNDASYLALSEAFAERRVDKTYLAIVYGVPRDSQGTIDRPIGRHPQDRKRMAVRPNGRAARTHYRCLAAAAGLSCLQIDLETGRTHQIRVHMKSIGHPLVGDPVYGEARWRGLPKPRQHRLARFPRPALHAFRIGLDHPSQGTRLEIESRVPQDMQTLWTSITDTDWPPAV